jgi:peptide/nickel transport system substrate-binding protein
MEQDVGSFRAMIRHTFAALSVAAVVLMMGLTPSLASKSNDTLNWATDREVAVVDPYYNNTRELAIMGHLGWDGLNFL